MIAELLEEAAQTSDHSADIVKTNALRLRSVNGRHVKEPSSTVDLAVRETGRFRSLYLPLLLLGITIFVRLLWTFWLPKNSLKSQASA